MAMVEIPQPISGIGCPDIGLTNLSLRNSGGMRAEKETVEEVEPRTTSPPLKEDMMFVALGKDVKESETVLAWALNNSRGMKICILHVHQPAQKLPMMGTKVPISLLEEHQVKAYHENERHEMSKILGKYIRLCDQAGVQAEKVCTEMDSIEKGIVQLISKHGVKWLVMGAAANKSYSRESKLNGINPEGESPLFQASPNTEAAQSLRSRSVAEGESQIKFPSSTRNYRRFRSDNLGMQLLVSSNVSGGLSPRGSLHPEGNSDWGGLFMKNSSVGSNFSTCSSSEINEDSSIVPRPSTEIVLQKNEDHHHSSMASSDIEGSMNDELYNQLEHLVVEAESCGKEAYEESIRRKKAEKDVIDAIRRAKASETMYTEELRRRREIEEALARGKEETDKMKRDLDEIMEKLRVAQEQKFSLERQIADSDQMVEELEQKMFSAVELLQKYKVERDKLQVERDNALRMAEELREKQAEEASSSSVSQFFSEFSFLEIEEATSNFSQALQIGKGVMEVNILSKLRHPNIVTLIGACPEAWALVYEYLPNGSLEDRLNCKNNTPPLSWKTRIRIAAELCSALIFLHSCQPLGIVHGDLKPANILLDENFVSKLSDFGICRALSQDEFSKNNTTLCCRTDPKGTFVYIDPEFLATGELTSKSDVYSFGIILLRLLTGRPALGITKEVQYALDKGNLKDLLDSTAGTGLLCKQTVAYLAISCADMNRRHRPDLASEVWRVLEPMKVSCGVSSLRLRAEIMQDPVVAADGFTYESEALKGWLESGHDTSPMTNLQLPHRDLVPNHALRSAIQEWLQQA
ncbi:UNVERIFIED_CONTAM: U-box domain-containing protein 33 [Sesamum calycinum]|uniref:RING-type E3 ubiquitin transferase n=1 Tax=Sesamum calycinum TaxID=2727403 RepID=A0AAW2T0F4_9LAMI